MSHCVCRVPLRDIISNQNSVMLVLFDVMVTACLYRAQLVKIFRGFNIISQDMNSSINFKIFL